MDADSIIVCDVVQSYSPISGGVKRYVHDKMTYAGRNGGLRQVLVVPGDTAETRREPNSRIHTVPSPRLPGSKSYRLLLNGWKIRSIIRKEAPDCLEVGNPYWPAWVTVKAGRELGIPVVGFYHSDFPRSLGKMLAERAGSDLFRRLLTPPVERYLAWLYNSMDVAVAATGRFERTLRDMHVERVVRTPLGTDTTLFRPPENPKAARAEVRSGLHLPENACILLYVGRFAAMKNLEETVAMMDHLPALLEEYDRPVHLVLAGDGEMRAELEREAAGRDDVTLMGYLDDRQDLVRLYGAADLFVFASTFETFGLVSLEAQACGTRVVGVRGGGMDETVQGEEPLIMAESAAPADLAAAVAEALLLREGADAAARRRERIVRHFSLEVCFDRMAALYRHLSGGKPVSDFPPPDLPGGAGRNGP